MAQANRLEKTSNPDGPFWMNPPFVTEAARQTQAEPVGDLSHNPHVIRGG